MKSNTWLPVFLKQESLPAAYADLVSTTFAPLAAQLATDTHTAPPVIGINGAQGTGKSTLAVVLQQILKHEHGLHAVVLSIDDLYLTREQRLQLAEDVHPLFATRGVPGTHDVALGLEVIETLQRGNPCTLPRFNKATDDREPETRWTPVPEPADLILFEGWCMAATPEPAERLPQPINVLEADADREGAWREHVNSQLAGPYTALFEILDRLIMLKAPDFECVCRWRAEQEDKLRARMATEGKPADAIMNAEVLARFMMHYERLTRWMLEEMPTRADIVFELQPDHSLRAPNLPN